MFQELSIFSIITLNYYPTYIADGITSKCSKCSNVQMLFKCSKCSNVQNVQMFKMFKMGHVQMFKMFVLPRREVPGRHVALYAAVGVAEARVGVGGRQADVRRLVHKSYLQTTKLANLI